MSRTAFEHDEQTSHRISDPASLGFWSPEFQYFQYVKIENRETRFVKHKSAERKISELGLPKFNISKLTYR